MLKSQVLHCAYTHPASITDCAFGLVIDWIEMDSSSNTPMVEQKNGDRPYSTAGVVAGATVVIVILIVAGYFAKPYFSKQPLSAEQELDLQKQAADAIKTKDFSACRAIKNEMYRVVCVNNIAINLAQETGDISYCSKIDGKLVPVSECESSAIMKLSAGKEDITICSQASEETTRTACQSAFYSSLAQKKNDPSVCDQNPDKIAAAACYNGFILSGFLSSGLSDAEALTCESFRGEDTRKDCESLKTVLGKVPPPPLEFAEACRAVISPVFKPLCLQTEFGSLGVPPAQ